MTRVLLCHNYYQIPGGEDEVFHSERHLLEAHGHEVQTYTRHNDDIEQMSRLSIATKTVWNRETYRDIRELCRRFRPDILHCTNTFPLISPAVYAAARRERVRVVQSLHNFRFACLNGYFLRDGKPCEKCLTSSIAWKGIQSKCYRDSTAGSAVVAGYLAIHRLLRTWHRYVDCFIALTEFAKGKAIAAGIPREKLIVKPNFVAPDPGMATAPGESAVFVGRLSSQKGIDTLLKTWQLSEEAPTLQIIGDGPERATVRAATEQDSRIRWLGHLPLAEVMHHIGQARCLIMPSISYETFGRTIVEAYAMGTPVIASRLGAMAELVDENRTGWSFEPGDPHDLRRALQACLDQPASARSFMRQEVRREFESKYTASRNYEQLLAIYQSVLGRDPIPLGASYESAQG